MWSLVPWLLRAVLRPAFAALVVATPAGHLCSLDVDTGALLAELPVSSTDVLGDGTAAVWSVEPGDEQAGRLARYRVSPAGLALERAVPFDALDGRILVPDEEPIVLGLAEGATLAIARHGGGTGFAWPTPASAFASHGHGGVAITTLDDATSPWRLHRVFFGPGGVVSMGETPLATPPAPCGARALETPGGIALVSVVDTHLVLSAGHQEIARASVPPGTCVEDALLLPDGRAVALLGPAPAAVLLSASGAQVFALPPGVLPHTPWLSHRLAHDPVRQRVWLATDGALAALDLRPMPAIATITTGCAATAVTIVRGP